MLLSVTCRNCLIKAKKNGKDKNGKQRYRCKKRQKRLNPEQNKLLGNMRIFEQKAVAVLKMLVEGNSIRAIERMKEIEKQQSSVCSCASANAART